ncbi:hypothetical protein ACQYWQ_18430 [Streptomyces sp. P6-2-1]|uniref:hypothetical protein n=1 Tax=unclassified Streptomyces TaxID=2593676 RepID=UPI003D362C91
MAAVSGRLPPDGVPMDEERIDAGWAEPWRPAQAAERLRGLAAPWCVAAGWALDLFRGGEPSRPHGDLEIAVPEAGFAELAARFPAYVWDGVGDGWVRPGAGPLPGSHQTWLRDPAQDRWLLDVFREPHEGGTWICRRDPAIRLPYGEIIAHTADGIPYLVPELVLLFKAKAARPKDEADFARVLPLLDEARRERLRGWLERVHPGHAWRERLG